MLSGRPAARPAESQTGWYPVQGCPCASANGFPLCTIPRCTESRRGNGRSPDSRFITSFRLPSRYRPVTKEAVGLNTVLLQTDKPGSLLMETGYTLTVAGTVEDSRCCRCTSVPLTIPVWRILRKCPALIQRLADPQPESRQVAVYRGSFGQRAGRAVTKPGEALHVSLPMYETLHHSVTPRLGSCRIKRNKNNKIMLWHETCTSDCS